MKKILFMTICCLLAMVLTTGCNNPVDPSVGGGIIVNLEPSSNITVHMGSTVEFHVSAWKDGKLVTNDPLDFEWEGTNKFGLFEAQTLNDHIICATLKSTGDRSQTPTITVISKEK